MIHVSVKSSISISEDMENVPVESWMLLCMNFMSGVFSSRTCLYNKVYISNGRKESRVTITLNKETTVFNLQNMFDILMSSSVANELLTVVHLNFILRYVTKLRV